MLTHVYDSYSRIGVTGDTMRHAITLGGSMSAELIALLEKAKTHKITPRERRAQMVSWVMSGMMHSSTMTREDIIRMLDEKYGPIAAEPLHYRACGLDGIYLLNGYAIEEHDGETAIAVTDVDGLLGELDECDETAVAPAQFELFGAWSEKRAA